MSPSDHHHEEYIVDFNQQPDPDKIAVRYQRSKYGYRASIDIPNSLSSLHCHDRDLAKAIAAVRRKFANYLAVKGVQP